MTTGMTLNSSVGKFISVTEAKKLGFDYLNLEKRNGLNEDQIIRSECFGADKISKILAQRDCVAIRIFQGVKYDENGESERRLFVAGVDSKGNIIESTEPQGGLKDGNGSAPLLLADGLTCPPFCERIWI